MIFADPLHMLTLVDVGIAGFGFSSKVRVAARVK